jgi:hypothetical protein
MIDFDPGSKYNDLLIEIFIFNEAYEKVELNKLSSIWSPGASTLSVSFTTLCRDLLPRILARLK